MVVAENRGSSIITTWQPELTPRVWVTPSTTVDGGSASCWHAPPAASVWVPLKVASVAASSPAGDGDLGARDERSTGHLGHECGG
ncbi:MAG: hypothetical protein QM813_03420, partial [Verrucomicrobiota bacterium]